MNTDNYKVLKLISGENIICELTVENGKFEISKPLLMRVHTQITTRGAMESLMLSRWVQPFTEQQVFDINPKHVIIVLPASPGLIVYYEGVLNKLKDSDKLSITDIDDQEESYDGLLEELETNNKTIH